MLTADLYGLPRIGEESAPLPDNSRSNVYEKYRLVKSGVGGLCGFTAYSSNVGTQFIQVHDSPGLPANGAVPEVVFPVAAGSIASALWLPPRTFRNGIVICNSTTAPTLTLGAADTFFDAQFV